ncbi:MAG: aminopeptidase P family protein [Gemmatimonadetes bacterium]|nr:aminopeptidase P family protein [Gemmatimonadota bacterium]
MSDRREFLKLGVAVSATAAAAAAGACAPTPRPYWWDTPQRDPGSGAVDRPDRLPIEWHRSTVSRIQAKLAERGLAGILLMDRWNIIYASGYFHTTTERPESLWIPAQGEPALFVPGLDRDLVETWWIKDYETYFDFPHAETSWWEPPSGKVDLLQWMARGIARRGTIRGTIALDHEPKPSEERRLKAILPRAAFVDAEDIVMQMRVIKTREEIALLERAIAYHDQMLEFCRAYVLEHGTSLYDWDVKHAATAYGSDLVMRDMRLTGREHSGAGVEISCGCRVGPATAYPHPNQFMYAAIQRGQAIQFAGIMVRIGGYGGEGYRACHIGPMTDEQRRMWEVHTEMVHAQREHSKPGVECRLVAQQVLKIAKDAGLEKYVYHRPAHGQGMEGHQKPYIALGDDTVLQEGMTFSNEPGLYDREGGYGYNHSNCLLIEKEGARQLNRTPLTKEWCWLTL